MSIVLGNSVRGVLVRAFRVTIKGVDDSLVVKAMITNLNWDRVHGIGHVFGMPDLIGGATHRRKVNVVLGASVVIAALDANMGHRDTSVGALESASSVMDFDLSWRLLVVGVAHAAAFLEV